MLDRVEKTSIDSHFHLSDTELKPLIGFNKIIYDKTVGRLALATGWNGCVCWENKLNTQPNLPLPYAIIMMSRRKNQSHRSRWIVVTPFSP